MLNPCERCKSGLYPTCKQFCHLHKMVVAESGSQSAYEQLQNKASKANRRKAR